MWSFPSGPTITLEKCCVVTTNLAAILSLQTKRRVTNDYTIRWHNRWYQLHKPISYPFASPPPLLAPVRWTPVLPKLCRSAW